MALPIQIEERLAALGWTSSEVVEAFIRGSGPGGQKVNKTSSTVTLRHLPTGIEVRCQRERSQSVNRLLAWEELAGRLEQRRHRVPIYIGEFSTMHDLPNDLAGMKMIMSEHVVLCYRPQHS